MEASFAVLMQRIIVVYNYYFLGKMKKNILHFYS